ncbi:hypothetical protein NCS57_00677400 [Fusarium keratoplasticum]|uniref:Uncharacterized protein n=1 Tax=Fusarium keratoplasticum TaxID=1328300 RepID=A0ACC0QXZ9_9HYPO|nr:hypothetical protein NCS57_00677400 [Fusarium keratoplasticum]KAI8668656.1 hypothetical protein NCS57_00677400 [Fusarium keratoplasticum]
MAAPPITLRSPPVYSLSLSLPSRMTANLNRADKQRASENYLRPYVPMAQFMTAIAYRAGPNGALDNYADFLAQVAQQESRSRGTKRPAPLSTEAHKENRKRLRRITFVKPVYAHETQINVAGLFRKWER